MSEQQGNRPRLVPQPNHPYLVYLFGGLWALSIYTDNMGMMTGGQWWGMSSWLLVLGLLVAVPVVTTWTFELLLRKEAGTETKAAATQLIGMLLGTALMGASLAARGAAPGGLGGPAPMSGIALGWLGVLTMGLIVWPGAALVRHGALKRTQDTTAAKLIHEWEEELKQANARRRKER